MIMLATLWVVELQHKLSAVVATSWIPMHMVIDLRDDVANPQATCVPLMAAMCVNLCSSLVSNAGSIDLQVCACVLPDWLTLSEVAFVAACGEGIVHSIRRV